MSSSSCIILRLSGLNLFFPLKCSFGNEWKRTRSKLCHPKPSHDFSHIKVAPSQDSKLHAEHSSFQARSHFWVRKPPSGVCVIQILHRKRCNGILISFISLKKYFCSLGTLFDCLLTQMYNQPITRCEWQFSGWTWLVFTAHQALNQMGYRAEDYIGKGNWCWNSKQIFQHPLGTFVPADHCLSPQPTWVSLLTRFFPL